MNKVPAQYKDAYNIGQIKAIITANENKAVPNKIALKKISDIVRGENANN